MLRKYSFVFLCGRFGCLSLLLLMFFLFVWLTSCVFYITRVDVGRTSVTKPFPSEFFKLIQSPYDDMTSTRTELRGTWDRLIDTLDNKSSVGVRLWNQTRLGSGSEPWGENPPVSRCRCWLWNWLCSPEAEWGGYGPEQCKRRKQMLTGWKTGGWTKEKDNKRNDSVGTWFPSVV